MKATTRAALDPSVQAAEGTQMPYINCRVMEILAGAPAAA